MSRESNPPERHCYNKVTYKDRATAKAALKRIRRKSRDKGLVMYECPTCSPQYHIGHSRWAA